MSWINVAKTIPLINVLKLYAAGLQASKPKAG